MKNYKKIAIGVGTALAAIGLALAMLGVNVPSYPSSGWCGTGQTCTPASLTTTGDVTVGDELYVSTDNSVCLDGIPCTAYIHHINDGSTMISGNDVKYTVKTVGRFSSGLEALISTDSEDHLELSGAAVGVGPTIQVISSGANAPLRLRAKGTGAVELGSTNATVSSAGAVTSSSSISTATYLAITAVASLPTCEAGLVGRVYLQQGGNTTIRSRLCLCTSDGNSPTAVYAWQDLATSTVDDDVSCDN